MSLAKIMQREQEKEDALRKAWALGDYVGECPNCKRQRLCSCDNGKTLCEKCNWCPEDDKYILID